MPYYYTSPIVYFDLETTRMSHASGHDDVEIVSIAAAPQGRGKEFSRFIIPEGDFNPVSSQINGLHKNYDELWSNEGYSLDADTPEDGLQAFMDYLDNISILNGNISLVLVAHNCFGFDSKVLCNQLVYHDINVVENLIGGFNDSLLIARSLYEGYKGFFTLDNLMSEFLGRSQSTVHDAKEDARGTRDIVRSMAKRNGLSVADCVDRIQQKDYDRVYRAAENRMDRFRNEYGQYY